MNVARIMVFWTLLVLPASVLATDVTTDGQRFPEGQWVSAMEELGIPGFAVAVADRQGIVFARGYGHRSLEPEAPFTATTSTYVASVTKVFTATAIMQLAEKNRLSLDGPVQNYLPRFTLKDEQLGRMITLRDLLCHRYGLDSAPIAFAEAYTGQIDDEKFYALLAEAASAGEWKYSNLHFTILGRVVDAVTGSTWQDYLRDSIFLPAGLSGTTANANVLYSMEESAVPLVMVQGKWQEATIRKTNRTMHAAGGMGSSAIDLAKWTGVFLNDGKAGDNQILKPESVSEMLLPHAKPGTRYYAFGRPEMGLGWYLGRLGAERLVHHFGSYTGAHAHCSFMPDHGIGVAVVANSNESSNKFLHQVAVDIYNVYLDHEDRDSWPDLIREISESDSEEPSADHRHAPGSEALSCGVPLENYAGEYSNEAWGTLTLYFNNDVLCGRIGDLRVDFLPDKTDQFKIETALGRKPIRFEIEGDRVVDVCIPEFWGHEIVFRRVVRHDKQ